MPYQISVDQISEGMGEKITDLHNLEIERFISSITMNRVHLSILISILAIFLIIAGCTEQKRVEPVVTPTVTPVSHPDTVPSTLSPTPNVTVEQTIFDQPVSKPPAELGVSVSVQKDPVYATITTTFDGGKGQDLVQRIQVSTTLSTGEVINKDLGKKKGDAVLINGTRGSDHVQVAVTFMNGDSYHITDTMVGQDRSGLQSVSPTPEKNQSTSEEGLYPGPVTEPPNSLSVSVEVNKEPIYRVITGTFRGGHGQSLISRIEMRAILSTGEFVVKQISSDIGATGEIQGTDGVDRIQVIVSFKNGETYKILEKTFGTRG